MMCFACVQEGKERARLTLDRQADLMPPIHRVETDKGLYVFRALFGLGHTEEQKIWPGDRERAKGVGSDRQGFEGQVFRVVRPGTINRYLPWPVPESGSKRAASGAPQQGRSRSEESEPEDSPSAQPVKTAKTAPAKSKAGGGGVAAGAKGSGAGGGAKAVAGAAVRALSALVSVEQLRRACRALPEAFERVAELSDRQELEELEELAMGVAVGSRLTALAFMQHARERSVHRHITARACRWTLGALAR